MFLEVISYYQTDAWKSEELLMMLTYKKVSNTNQYNSKATRLAAYNAHKDDESEMEDLDPPHDH